MSPEYRNCKHCGTPFRDGSGSGAFCCSGCEYVYRLIREEGFDRYYELKDRRGTPVQSVPFVDRDLDWATKLQADAEDAGGGVATAELDLRGISCVGCVWLVDKLFRRCPGAVGIEINTQLGRMQLRWETARFELVPFLREIQQFGYLAGPARGNRRDSASLLVWRIGLCAVFALNGMLFTLPAYLGMEPDFEYARLFELLSLAFATLSLAVGGSYFIARAWRSLRAGILHIDLPIALGILLAYAGSIVGWLLGVSSFIYFDFVAVFVFLMLAGRWTQEAAVERNRNRVLGDPNQIDSVLRLGADGSVAAVAPADLAPGDVLEVPPGRTLPVQGRLVSSSASVSLESINGESVPLDCARGRILPSGALNIGASVLRVEALERWADSLLARLLGGTGDWSARDPVFERILKAYVAIVLFLSVAGGLVWALSGAGYIQALQVAVSVLVVSCPCSLGVAHPLAIELATLAARARRVFVRRNDLWSRLGRVRKIIFDKTGTVTLERPELTNPEALEGLDPQARQRLFALVETSLHPVSRSLRELLYAGFPDLRSGQVEAESVEEVPGGGIALKEAAGLWTLGRPGWLGGGPGVPADGGDATEFALDGTVLASFRMADRIRPETREEIEALRSGGFAIYLLSGDRTERVAQVASALGIRPERALAEQRPDDKAAFVRSIDKSDTMMVGDGVNDSLAFDAAYCRGTPLVDRSLLEGKADFFLVGRAAGGVGAMLRIAACRRRAARSVFAFAVLYNVLAVSLCLAGWMNPLLAAILMPLSGLVSIALVFYAMRPALDSRERPAPSNP